MVRKSWDSCANRHRLSMAHPPVTRFRRCSGRLILKGSTQLLQHGRPGWPSALVEWLWPLMERRRAGPGPVVKRSLTHQSLDICPDRLRGRAQGFLPLAMPELLTFFFPPVSRKFRRESSGGFPARFKGGISFQRVQWFMSAFGARLNVFPTKVGGFKPDCGN